MDRWKGKVAVVTGASAGIGLETAKALLREGMIVVGLARRRDKMLKDMNSTTGPGKFFAIECDVSKDKDVFDAFHQIRETFRVLHVLVNNAGMIRMKSIEEAEMVELEQIIGTNLMGAVYCTKHALKIIKETNEEAHIVNISSVAGLKVPNHTWFGGANCNVYSATKFALTALSEVFVNELRGAEKIRVTNISPGLVSTDIFTDKELITTGLANNPVLKSEDVADSIVYALGTPSHVQITQLTIKPLGEPF